MTPHRLSSLIWIAGSVLAACSDDHHAKSTSSKEAEISAPFTLPTPNIIMRAEPQPDLTYWAPEGSTVTNHPDVPGIWFAERDGRRVATYFGDACGASRYQHLVGKARQQAQVQAPSDGGLRTFCTTCAHTDDLRPNRLNVIFDEATQIVRRVECF